MSISFDRAAEYYDRTRALPEGLIPQLAAELPRGAPCLEIGVGTGRIALPLVEQGIHLVGIDISTEMLRRLAAKSNGRGPDVVIADATQLPFGDRTFACAIAAHVLHLVPEWRSAVAELLRVLRPGGVIVASRGGREEGEHGWMQSVRRRFFEEAAAGHWPPGASSIEQVDHHMLGLGATMRDLPLPAHETERTVNEVIANLEAGYWSACWELDEATRTRAAAATREWAGTAIGDLDARRPAVQRSVWHLYELGEQR
jgi:SAM-dependent methyltransferase